MPGTCSVSIGYRNCQHHVLEGPRDFKSLEVFCLHAVLRWQAQTPAERDTHEVEDGVGRADRRQSLHEAGKLRQCCMA